VCPWIDGVELTLLIRTNDVTLSAQWDKSDLGKILKIAFVKVDI
jgi:hypothetical protein